MTSRRSVLAGMAGLAAGACFGQGPAASGIRQFRRGVGVSHVLGWAEVAADGSYGDAPFSAPRVMRWPLHSGRTA